MLLPPKACALIDEMKPELELRKRLAGARIARDDRYPCKPASTGIKAKKKTTARQKENVSKT
jgi:hypothetical protein